jgi:hypothetical protein
MHEQNEYELTPNDAEELIERYRREHPGDEIDPERFRQKLADAVHHHPDRGAILDRVNHGARFYARRREPGEETPGLVRGNVPDDEPELEFSVGFPDDLPAYGELAGTRDLMGTIALGDVLKPPQG